MKYVFVIFYVLLLPMFAAAATLQVGVGKPYATIKKAIEAAKSGDVILIDSGRYAEGEIVIVKPLTLRGNNWPVLDGTGKNQILCIRSNDVTVEGFQVQNSGYSSTQDWGAIKVINSNNVIIKRNRLNNNTFGIYLQNCTNSQVLNNRVIGHTVDEVNSGNAIHCWKSDQLTIRNNYVSGHRDGIYFEFVTNSLIANNTSFRNLRYGIHFMFSNNDTYTKNTFRQNGAGVAVMFSKQVTMTANHFEESWGSGAYGILMKEISDGKVAHNVFLKNTVGIFMEGTSRIQVTQNIFKNNGWAMRVQSSCVDNDINHNNYVGNTFDVGSNGELQLNKFSENYWDKYEGYDLDKNGIGDVQYQPVSLYSMIVEKIPAASLLLRSFMVTLMDRAERLLPGITPIQLKDDRPLMKPVTL